MTSTQTCEHENVRTFFGAVDECLDCGATGTFIGHGDGGYGPCDV